MKECSKSIARRLSNSNFISKYFRGDGVDIGGKPDPLSLYKELFPLVNDVKTWDWEDGDAQYLETVDDNCFDFVHSSHCLEHLVDPAEGLRNWFRVLKPDGYLIITVPDEDMYEQGVFPSTFNGDHKWTFTIYKETSWSDRSINVIELLSQLDSAASIEKIELLTSTYRNGLPRYDQTLTPVAECGIEIIVRKRTPEECEAKGKWQRTSGQPSTEMRLHLNQYKDDLASLKSTNTSVPPFTNDSEL